MYCFMIGTRVAAERSGTEVKKTSLVVVSIPPKTHTPLTPLPLRFLVNLHLPNLLSSISTIWPGPIFQEQKLRYELIK